MPYPMAPPTPMRTKSRSVNRRANSATRRIVPGGCYARFTMTRRSRSALVVVLVSGWCGACATSGGGDTTGASHADASAGDEPDAGVGPSPDAVVLGDDAGDDAAASDDATGDADAAVGGKSCAGLADGTLCGSAPDICHDAPVCKGGVCAPATAKADGFVCAIAPDACHTDGTCKARTCGAIGTRADGYAWSAGDDTARCCGGKAIHTTSDSDCGACGIVCNTGNGESCKAVAGHWFCNGCVASAACWSRCCSLSFNPPSCAASDCAGNCSAQYCPPGTHCVSGGTTSSDYCAY